MTKKLLCITLAIVFAISSVPVANAAKTSKSTYEASDALAYAKSHWNDGKGLCAEFVSDCLKAGGVDDVYEPRVVNLFNALKDKGWGEAYKLTLTDGTSGRISMSQNSDKVKEGDPVFYYCNVCNSFEHVVLCNGADSYGYMKDYAHNNPHDGNKTTYTFRHCGTNNWTMYSIRMDEKEPLYGKETDVEAPKISTASNFCEGIQVEWNKIDGATGYRVYKRTLKGSWQYLDTVTATKYIDATAKNGETFIYTVRACKDKVFSAYYAGVEITRLARVELKTVSVSGKNAVVTWTENEAADGYYIYRKKNSESWRRYAELNKSTNTKFVDSQLENGAEYIYRVVPFKGNNAGAYSATGLELKYLAAPELISAANEKTGVAVKWKAVEGVRSYRVYRRGEGEKNWSYLDTVTGTTFTDSNVKSGKYYRYTVRSVNEKNYGGYDSDGKLVLCVATPKLLKAVDTDKKIKLIWEKVSGASGYYVYHKLTTDKNWTCIATVKDADSYEDEDIVYNKDYQYTVRAFSGKSKSSFDANGLVCKSKVELSVGEIEKFAEQFYDNFDSGKTNPIKK